MRPGTTPSTCSWSGRDDLLSRDDPRPAAQPSSLAAVAVALAMLKDWLPWSWAWWVIQAAVAAVILAAVLVPERK